MSSYVADSFSDSSEEERFWKEPDDDWEVGGVDMYQIHLQIPIVLSFRSQSNAAFANLQG